MIASGLAGSITKVGAISKTISNATRIQAGTLKDLKSLIRTLSRPESSLTKQELSQLESLVKQYGGRLRYDLNPIKGKNMRPHVQVEGLGKSVESRHIWLK